MESVSSQLSIKRMVRFDGEGTIKAVCDLVIDERFLIKGLRVVDGKRGVFVSMPRQQGKDQQWYDSVVALTQEAKEEVGKVVLEAYQQESDGELIP